MEVSTIRASPITFTSCSRLIDEWEKGRGFPNYVDKKKSEFSHKQPTGKASDFSIEAKVLPSTQACLLKKQIFHPLFYTSNSSPPFYYSAQVIARDQVSDGTPYLGPKFQWIQRVIS